MAFKKSLSHSDSKDKARQAVLEFLPSNIKSLISLPAESFVFEAEVKFKNPDIKICGYEKTKSVINNNRQKRFLMTQKFLDDYIHGDVLKADLSTVDFAWLDLCNNPTLEVQSRFITQARNVKPGSRIVITLVRRVRNIKNNTRPIATIDKFINLIHRLTNGKVVSQYDYVNEKSPMAMLFIQF